MKNIIQSLRILILKVRYYQRKPHTLTIKETKEAHALTIKKTKEDN